MNRIPRGSVTLNWLVQLRWFAVVAQAGLVLAVHALAPVEVPVAQMLVLLGIVALTNGGLAWAVRRDKATLNWATAALAFDVVILTLALDASGGPMNPFSFLYVVQVSLAAVALRGWATGLIAVLSIAGYGALYFRGHQHHHHHRPELMNLHLDGMWVAMAVTAVIIGYFIAVLQSQLERKEAEIDEMRRSKARHEKLDTLTSMAAGAAHELSTPLGTIAITAKELALELEESGNDELAEEARLIREETRRCQGILKRLSVSSGENLGEELVWESPATLMEDAISRVHAEDRVHVKGAPDVRVKVTRAAVVESLSAMVQNALDANESAGSSNPVKVEIRVDGGMCRITIDDDGSGIAETDLERILEPFYTTKSKGMGLGLFVATRLMDDLGGELTIANRESGGARVTVWLPIDN